jgi:glycine dehydrogenase
MNAPDRRSLSELEHGTPFADRHIGPRPAELARMLDVIGVESLEQLAQLALPPTLATPDAGPGAVLDLPAPATEVQALAELRALAAQCHPRVAMIGMGYHGTVTPPVIRRSVLENPAWYTAYTPYQPEISQGRLEALLNFQTMVCDLTGLPVASSSKEALATGRPVRR